MSHIQDHARILLDALRHQRAEQAADPGSPGPGTPAGAELLLAERLSDVVGELARREAWQEALLDRAVGAVAVVDPDGSIGYATPAFRRLLGTHDLLELGVVPDDRDALHTSLRRALVEARPVGFRLRTEEGRIVRGEVANALGEPSIRGLVVTLSDDTERVALAEELDRRDRWYRRLAESAFGSALVFDRAGRLTAVVGPAESELEVDTEGWSFLDRIHPGDREQVAQRIREVASEPGTSAVAQARAIGPDGSWHVYAGVITNLFDDPVVEGLVVNFRDITDLAVVTDRAERLQERYERLFDAAPYPMWLYDEATLRIVEVNQAAVDRYGWDRDTFTSMTILDLRPDEERRRLEEHLAQPQSERRRRVWTHRTASGELLEVEISARSIELDGQMRRLVVAFEVTERERTRRELLRSEARQRALLDAIPDLIFHIAADGTYLDYKPAGVGTLVAPDEFLGRRLDEFFPPGLARRSMQAIADAIAQDEIQTIEYQLVYDEGLRQFEARIVPIPGREEVYAIVRDVTERNRREATFRDVEAQHRAIVDALPDHLLRVAGGHTIVSYRSADRSGALFEPDAVLGRTVMEIFGDAEAVGEAIGAALAARETVGVEVDLDAPSGRRRVEVRAAPLPGSDDALLIVRDVSDRAEAMRRLVATSEELARQAAELRASNDDLAQFAHIASHDLVEPLRTVATYRQLLDRRYGDRLDDDGREFLRYIGDGVDRLGTLVAELREYSKVGTGALASGPVDIAEVIADALRTVEPAIRARGAEVTVGALPVVLGDRPALTRVMENLVGNAVKFVPADRAPRVHVDAVAEDRTHRDGARIGWRIRVADNGIGIPADHRERVFEPFRRLHARHEFDGTGLGLALVRRAIERMGGTVEVDGPGLDDAGVTVSFWLPDGRP